MPKLRVHVTITLDGYIAGPGQRLEDPLGEGGTRMHEWVFAAWEDRRSGKGGLDVEVLDRADANIGATIMGRNMFGPVRGEWPDESWRGWWGEEPPYHHDVFVLTHHTRPDLPMAGGTTFHFTDEPIERVLERAFAAADGRDVRLGGGAAAIQQYLSAGLVDELELSIAPLLLGGGERLLDNVGTTMAGYRVTEMVSSAAATHARLVRK